VLQNNEISERIRKSDKEQLERKKEEEKKKKKKKT